MSDGLKTALILGGAAVAGFLIWKNNQPTAANLVGAGSGNTSTTAAAPGAPLAPPPAAPPGLPPPSGSSSSGGGGSSTLGAVGKLALAPITIPTMVSLRIGSTVAHAGVTAVKSVGSAAATVGHAIASLF